MTFDIFIFNRYLRRAGNNAGQKYQNQRSLANIHGRSWGMYSFSFPAAHTAALKDNAR